MAVIQIDIYLRIGTRLFKNLGNFKLEIFDIKPRNIAIFRDFEIEILLYTTSVGWFKSTAIFTSLLELYLHTSMRMFLELFFSHV